MRRQVLLSLVTIVAVLSVLLAGCSTPYSVDKGQEIAARRDQEIRNEAFNKRLFQAAAQLMVKSSSEYKLGPGDLIEVSVFGIEDLQNMEGELDSLGRVFLPLVGRINLNGLTVSEAQKKLRKAFSVYIKNPRISIQIKEYRSYRVSVLGRVNKPDVYALRGSRTILDVLAMAGGLMDDASHSIMLIKPSLGKSMIIDLDRLVGNPTRETADQAKITPKDLMLNPGDVIYVPRAESFFVDGYVNKPGSFPISSEITLTQAIALAGGMKDDADPENVYIYRIGKDGRRYAIKVNLNDIRSGKKKDPKLVKNDVVLVPSSGKRVFFHRFFRFFGIGFSGGSTSSYGVSVGNR